MSPPPREILTCSLGVLGSLSSVPYWNALTTRDQENSTLYRCDGKACRPRFMALYPRHMPLENSPGTQKVSSNECADCDPERDACKISKPHDSTCFSTLRSNFHNHVHFELDLQENSDQFGGHSATVQQLCRTTCGSESSENARKGKELSRWHECITSQYGDHCGAPHGLHSRTLLPVTLPATAELSSMPNQLASQSPLSMYGLGKELFASTREVVLDNFRYFLEECEHPQGIQFFTEADSIFGGLLPALTEAVQDEIGPLAFIVRGSIRPSVTEVSSHNIVSEINETSLMQTEIARWMSAVEMNNCSTLYMPIDLTAYDGKIDVLPGYTNHMIDTTLSNEWFLPSLLAIPYQVAMDCNLGRERATVLTPGLPSRRVSCFHEVAHQLQYSSSTRILHLDMAFPHPRDLSHIRHGSRKAEDFFHYSSFNCRPKTEQTYSQLWSSRGIETSVMEIEHVLRSRQYAQTYSPKRAIYISAQPYPLHPLTPSKFLGLESNADLSSLKFSEVPVAVCGTMGSQTATWVKELADAINGLRKNSSLRRSITGRTYPYMEHDDWVGLFEHSDALIDDYSSTH